MKQKEVVYLLVAMAIFAGIGIFLYSQFGSKKGAKATVEVEIIEPISGEFDSEALKQVTDETKVRDFTVPVDLSKGLGNPRPFGPF